MGIRPEELIAQRGGAIRLDHPQRTDEPVDRDVRLPLAGPVGVEYLFDFGRVALGPRDRGKWVDVVAVRGRGHRVHGVRRWGGRWAAFDQGLHLFLSYQRVVINIDLGIHRKDSPLSREDQGIDLRQGAVKSDEHLIQAGHDSHQFLQGLSAGKGSRL
jgi:hypothetical protein